MNKKEKLKYVRKFHTIFIIFTFINLVLCTIPAVFDSWDASFFVSFILFIFNLSITSILEHDIKRLE